MILRCGQALLLIALAFLSLGLSACSLSSNNDDPLAYPGARSDSTLQSVLDEMGVVLPAEAEVLGWGDTNALEMDIAVEASMPCESVEQLVQESSLNKATAAYPTKSDWVGQQAPDHGWKLGELRDLKAWADYVPKRNFFREVVSGRVGSDLDTCRVFATAYSV